MNSSLGTSSRPHGQPKMKLALAPRRSRSPARNPPPAPKTPTRNKEPTREHKRSFPIAQRKTTNPPPVTNAPTRKKKPQGEHKSPFPIAQRKNTNLPLRPSTRSRSPSPSPSTGKGGNKSLTTSMVGNLIRRRADAVVDSGNPSSAIKRRRAQPRRRYKEATLYTSERRFRSLLPLRRLPGRRRRSRPAESRRKSCSASLSPFPLSLYCRRLG